MSGQNHRGSVYRVGLCLQVLIGLKFLRKWPFLGRLRLCFVEAPFFQVTVKPIFSHGLDVTEIPGISGWVVGALHRSAR